MYLFTIVNPYARLPKFVIQQKNKRNSDMFV